MTWLRSFRLSLPVPLLWKKLKAILWHLSSPSRGEVCRWQIFFFGKDESWLLSLNSIKDNLQYLSWIMFRKSGELKRTSILFTGEAMLQAGKHWKAHWLKYQQRLDRTALRLKKKKRHLWVRRFNLPMINGATLQMGLKRTYIRLYFACNSFNLRTPNVYPGVPRRTP